MKQSVSTDRHKTRTTLVVPRGSFPEKCATQSFSFAAAALFLLLSSCGDEKLVIRPCAECPFVVLRGDVRGPDGPVDGLITAWRSDYAFDLFADRYAARVDSGGQYRLSAPPGSYYLTLQSGGAWLMDHILVWTHEGLKPLEQLHAGGEPLSLALEDPTPRMDFTFGGVRLNVTIAGGPEHELLRSDVVEIAGDFEVTAHARSESGQAVLEFPLLLPGNYLISVTEDDRVTWYPGVADRDYAESVRVSALERTFVDMDLSMLRPSVARAAHSLGELENATPKPVGVSVR